MQWALKLTDAQAQQALDRWLANQGAWGLDLHNYAHLPPEWTQSVHCTSRGLLGELVAQGGLVLSAHSQHHNRLGAFLGDSGVPVWGVAGPEEGSPYQPWTGRYVRLINGGSEARFGGGRYVFTDNLRGLVRDCRHAFERGHAVVSVSDVPLGSPQSVGVSIFGRELPVATALIDLALSAGAPIWAAIMVSDLEGGHTVRMVRLTAIDTPAVVRAYGAVLEGWLREEPWFWQGWAWWLNLPALDPEVSGTPIEIAERLEHFMQARPVASRGTRWLRRIGAWQERVAPLMRP
ncbi:hypothetical protein [Inhella gelatinilytica]|uniref:Uncharacterized protein n=1 Tax=Inhella gelatinilytica TaxID=2795030 RepID=A0A931IXD3_9BURK|nr:hypothetical protein [Inhella gelatinilytica]MBH9553316.1 hypothetical protein [Inhella gelatinilytica]